MVDSTTAKVAEKSMNGGDDNNGISLPSGQSQEKKEWPAILPTLAPAARTTSV